MTWQGNLRAEIGALFAYYARGEELSEFTQGLWAKRRATVLLRARAYYDQIKADPLRYAALRQRQAKTYRAWFARHRAPLKPWLSEESKAAQRAWYYAHHETEKASRAARQRRARSADWEAEPMRVCAQCSALFKRPFTAPQKTCFCQKQCERAAFTQRRRENNLLARRP